MCGIVGIWHLDGEPVNIHSLDAFTDSLAHRGPDGRGTFIDPEVTIGLGHRRLSILDLSDAGRQPMSYAQQRYWITYNGEIYNFIELRSELEGLGHRFRSESDTEVILAAYAQWGEKCQLKFNGMWAFAIWDRIKRVLFLSRDRFGIKPLHYYYDGRRFAFASEMKAFLALRWFRLSFDPFMVATALIDSNSIEGTEDCLLQGLKRLRGGHSLILRQGSEPQTKQWWHTLDHLEAVPRDFDQQIERFRELFFDACRIRMRSDVSVGTALSGGLDSSSVLCTMNYIRSRSSNGERLAADWQRAFVATYPDTIQDERRYAEEIIRHTGAIPVYRKIDPLRASDEFDQFQFQFEEIQDFAIGPWLIYRELRREGIVVSMDGHGADETLAGYRHYPEEAMYDALKPWPNLIRMHALRSTLKAMYPDGMAHRIPTFSNLARHVYLRPVRESLVRGIKKFPGVYDWVKYNYRKIKKLPSRDGAAADTEWLNVAPKSFSSSDLGAQSRQLSRLDSLNKRLYTDFHFTLLPTILRGFDRCSMGHGVEIRAPFMDWRLVCYAFSLPSTSKIGLGFTKRILRESMCGILPESIRTRTSKVGFSSPMYEWVKGPLKAFTLDNVNSQSFLQSDIWNGPEIRKAVEESYTREDYRQVQEAWPFIQAIRLSELFKAKSCEKLPTPY